MLNRYTNKPIAPYQPSNDINILGQILKKIVHCASEQAKMSNQPTGWAKRSLEDAFYEIEGMIFSVLDFEFEKKERRCLKVCVSRCWVCFVYKVNPLYWWRQFYGNATE